MRASTSSAATPGTRFFSSSGSGLRPARTPSPLAFRSRSRAPAGEVIPPALPEPTPLIRRLLSTRSGSLEILGGLGLPQRAEHLEPARLDLLDVVPGRAQPACDLLVVEPLDLGEP